MEGRHGPFLARAAWTEPYCVSRHRGWAEALLARRRADCLRRSPPVSREQSESGAEPSAFSRLAGALERLRARSGTHGLEALPECGRYYFEQLTVWPEAVAVGQTTRVAGRKRLMKPPCGPPADAEFGPPCRDLRCPQLEKSSRSGSARALRPVGTNPCFAGPASRWRTPHNTR